MSFIKGNKILLTTGLAALSSLALTGIYFFLKRKKTEVLNKWLEKYALFIEEKIKQSNYTLNLEIAAYIVNFLNEVEEHFFLQNYPEVEADRIASLPNNCSDNKDMNTSTTILKGDEKVYNELLIKTMEIQNQIFNEACNFLEERFNHKMVDVKNVIEASTKKSGNAEWNKLCYNCKFPYRKEDLPIIDTKSLRKLYLDFGEAFRLNKEAISNEIKNTKKNPYNKETYMLNIYNIKYRGKDSFKQLNNFSDKYLDALIDNDSELKNDNVIINMKEKIRKMMNDED